MRASSLAALPLLAFAVSCATGPARRLDLDVEARHSGGVGSVEVLPKDFQAAVKSTFTAFTPPARPRYAGLHMFDGDGLAWMGGHHALVASSGLRVLDVAAGLAPDDVTLGYGMWCRDKGTPGDCLGLLESSALLDENGRRSLALEVALSSVWAETRNALKEIANPDAIRAMLLGAMTAYLMLWVLPEPLTKGLAAVLTAAMISYLGVDTVWTLFQGWRQLVTAAKGATSFEQVREAGNQFGKVIGRNSARIFVMLASVALGQTINGFAARLPSLPDFVQASSGAAAQTGLRLSAVAQVKTVALSPAGAFTVSVASPMAVVGGPIRPGNVPLRLGERVAKYWRKAEFKGKVVYQRDDLIDPARVDEYGRTNLQRMKQGLAPKGADGEPLNLHHTVQAAEGPVAEVTHTFHNEYRNIIHINPQTIPSGIDRAAFVAWRRLYWINRAKDFMPGGMP